MDKPTDRYSTETLLRAEGWELVACDRFANPLSDFQKWKKDGYPYLLRLAWPVGADCNGCTTLEIEICKALEMIRDANFLPF